MGMKGLRVAHDLLGTEGDPNAPFNRPSFDEPEAAEEAVPPAGDAAGLTPDSELALEKSGRPRRSPKLPRRHMDEEGDTGGTGGVRLFWGVGGRAAGGWGGEGGKGGGE